VIHENKERNTPSKRLKLTLEQVATAKETLDAIPAAPKELRPITVSDAIRTLTPTIRRLLERGHSRDAVLRFLKEQGKCSPSTFKECYRPGRGRNAAKSSPDSDGSGQTTPAGSLAPAAAGSVGAASPSGTPLAAATAGPVARPAAPESAADSRADQRPTPGQHPAVAKAS
jgi:hypothetical protein